MNSSFRLCPDGVTEGSFGGCPGSRRRIRHGGSKRKRARAFVFGGGFHKSLRAEREGFEPSRGLAPPTRFAGESLEPLGPLSRPNNLSAAPRLPSPSPKPFAPPPGFRARAGAVRPLSHAPPLARRVGTDLRRDRGAVR